MISVNDDMARLLYSLLIHRDSVLPARLNDLLGGKLTEESGCWFLAKLREGATAVSVADFPDRTGLECFVNHIHVSDFVEAADMECLLGQSLVFVDRLREKLKISGKFRIIVSASEGDCSVRFHLVRPGEQWLTDDLNSYREEALLVLSTTGPN